MWISACANFTLLICFIVCSLARCLVSHKLLVLFICDVNCLLLWYIWKSSWTRRKHGNSLGKVSCQTGVTFSIDVSRVGNWQGVLSSPVILSSWDWLGVLSVSLNFCWYFMFQILKFFNRLPVLMFNQIYRLPRTFSNLLMIKHFKCSRQKGAFPSGLKVTLMSHLYKTIKDPTVFSNCTRRLYTSGHGWGKFSDLGINWHVLQCWNFITYSVEYRKLFYDGGE